MSKSIKLSELGMVSGKAYFIKVSHKETSDGAWSPATPLLKFATKPAFAIPLRARITSPLSGSQMTSDSVELTVSYQSPDGLSVSSTLYQVSESQTFEPVLKEGEKPGSNITITDLPKGKYLWIRVKSKDSLGNVSEQWSNSLRLLPQETVTRIGVLTINGTPVGQFKSLSAVGTVAFTCEAFVPRHSEQTLKQYMWKFSVMKADSSSETGVTEKKVELKQSFTPNINLPMQDLQIATGEWLRVEVLCETEQGESSLPKEPLDLAISDGTMRNPTVELVDATERPVVLRGSPYTYVTSPLKSVKWVIRDHKTNEVIYQGDTGKVTHLKLTKGNGLRLKVDVTYTAENGQTKSSLESFVFQYNHTYEGARPVPAITYPANRQVVDNTYTPIKFDTDDETANIVTVEIKDLKTEEVKRAILNGIESYDNELCVDLIRGQIAINTLQSALNGEMPFKPEGQYEIKLKYKCHHHDVESDWSQPVQFTTAKVLATRHPKNESVNSPRIIKPEPNSVVSTTQDPITVQLSAYQTTNNLPWKATEIEFAHDREFRNIFLSKRYSTDTGDTYTDTYTFENSAVTGLAYGEFYIRARHSSANPEFGGENLGDWGAPARIYSSEDAENFFIEGVLTRDASMVSFMNPAAIEFTSRPYLPGTVFEGGGVSWNVELFYEGSSTRSTAVEPLNESGVSKHTVSLTNQVTRVEVGYTNGRSGTTPTIHTVFLRPNETDFEKVNFGNGDLYVLKPTLLPRSSLVETRERPDHAAYAVATNSVVFDTTKPKFYKLNGELSYENVTTHLVIEISAEKNFSKAKKRVIATENGYTDDSGKWEERDIFFFDGFEHDTVYVRTAYYYADTVSPTPAWGALVELQNLSIFRTAPLTKKLTTTASPEIASGNLTIPYGIDEDILRKASFYPLPELSLEVKAHSAKTGKPYRFKKEIFPIAELQKDNQVTLQFSAVENVILRLRLVGKNGEVSPWSDPYTIDVITTRFQYRTATVAPTFATDLNGQEVVTETVTFTLNEAAVKYSEQNPSYSYWVVTEHDFPTGKIEYLIEKSSNVSTLTLKPRQRGGRVSVRAAYSLGITSNHTAFSETTTVRFTKKIGEQTPAATIPVPYDQSNAAKAKDFVYEKQNAAGKTIYGYLYRHGYSPRYGCASTDSEIAAIEYQVSLSPYFDLLQDEFIVKQKDLVKTVGQTYNAIQGVADSLVSRSRRLGFKSDFYLRARSVTATGHVSDWTPTTKYVYAELDKVKPIVTLPLVTDIETTRRLELSIVPFNRYNVDSGLRWVDFNAEVNKGLYGSEYVSKPKLISTPVQSKAVFNLPEHAAEKADIQVLFDMTKGGGEETWYPVRLKQEAYERTLPETPTIVSPSPGSIHRGSLRLSSTPYKGKEAASRHTFTTWTVDGFINNRWVNLVNLKTNEFLTFFDLIYNNQRLTNIRVNNKPLYCRASVDYYDDKNRRGNSSPWLYFTLT